MKKLLTLIKVFKQYIRILYWSFLFSRKKIKSNKVIFWSFRGRGYSCNPKYISDSLLNDNSNVYDVVWAFTKPEDYKCNRNNKIRIVKYYSREFFYELMTSKLIITNTRFGIDFHKRKEQKYIQTWHGAVALKAVEKDASNELKFFYKLNAKNDSRKIDYFVSGSKFRTENIRNAFWYKGSVLEVGTPRNDILFNGDKASEKVRSVFKLKNEKIVLYAPTFRKNNAAEVYNLDSTKILQALNQKFSGKFVLMCRLHPNIKHLNIFKNVENVIDASHYDDMQELLASVDVLITDFSSSMFDVAVVGKKCFLYASDFDNYVKKERRLYFDIEKDIPFSLAKNNEELVNCIMNFDESRYMERLDVFKKKIGYYENGTASKKIVELIKSELNK